MGRCDAARGHRIHRAGGTSMHNDVRSASKTFTAFMAGQAIAGSAIRSADEPAFDLLPELAPFRHGGALEPAISLMDLLTLSSARSAARRSRP